MISSCPSSCPLGLPDPASPAAHPVPAQPPPGPQGQREQLAPGERPIYIPSRHSPPHSLLPALEEPAGGSR